MGLIMGQKHPARDRSFILIGQSCDGKSTLGNLLIGGIEQNPFPTHVTREAAGLTRVPKGEFVELDRQAIFGEGKAGDQLRIHVVDLPGLSDPSFSLQGHTKNIITCIKYSHIEMSETFLIIINLHADFISQSTFEAILQLEDLMARSSYKLFGNATIVFTHADLLVGEGNPLERRNLEEILMQKLQDARWAYLKILLERVDNRFIFVNGKDMTQGNRKRILRELFFLTKPVLRIVFHGNNHFTRAEIKAFLKASGNFSITEEKYRLECNFSPDADLFNSQNVLDLEGGLIEASRKLRQVSQGISVMVILISLIEPFTMGMEKLINQIPDSYQLDEGFNMEFWKYSLVIFKIGPVPNEQSAIGFIKRNVKNNPALMRILAQAKERYTWIETDIQDPPVERIIKQCVAVKKSCEGRDFINQSVIYELNKLCIGLRPQTPGSPKKFLPIQDQLCTKLEAQCDPKLNNILTRTLVLNPGFISGKLARFYLKTMNPNISEKLLGKMFPYENEKISNEDFIRRIIEKNTEGNRLERTQEELLDSMQ